MSIYDYDEEEVRRVLAEEYAQEYAQKVAKEVSEKHLQKVNRAADS